MIQTFVNALVVVGSNMICLCRTCACVFVSAHKQGICMSLKKKRKKDRSCWVIVRADNEMSLFYSQNKLFKID